MALLLWPLVAVWLYKARPVGEATLWTILGGFLLLPVDAAIKIEGVPQFDKISVSNLAALAGCFMVSRRHLRLKSLGIAGVLLFIFLFSPLITAELNRDPIVLPYWTIEGETFYDAVSAVVGQFLFVIPFFLGRQILRGAEDSERMLRVLVIAGLAYSVPMWFEIRMSPQLHTWIYGYFPTSFNQQFRDGGFRPVVFLGHGLVAAFFIMTTAVASAAFWRAQVRVFKFSPAGTTAYLCTLLALCKTLGDLIYGAVLVPLVRWTQPRLQVRLAVVLASVALLYPVFRAADIIPTDAIVTMISSISAERAGSLKTRFDNESQLLARASERPLFGWGRWGRNRVYNGETGQDTSFTDGRWVITIGSWGIFGFLAEFSLLSLPIFRAFSIIKFTESSRERIFFAALTLILGVNMIELLPNSTFTPWTWLLAGSLLGRSETLSAFGRGRDNFIDSGRTPDLKSGFQNVRTRPMP
jgi:hypothetical protein